MVCDEAVEELEFCAGEDIMLVYFQPEGTTLSSQLHVMNIMQVLPFYSWTHCGTCLPGIAKQGTKICIALECRM